MPIDRVVYLCGFVFIVAGLALSFMAHKYRAEDAPPYTSLHPRHWQPIWRRRSRYVSDAGYWYHLAGGVLCAAGAILLLVEEFLHR